MDALIAVPSSIRTDAETLSTRDRMPTTVVEQVESEFSQRNGASH